jgi:hypothetical protein
VGTAKLALQLPDEALMPEATVVLPKVTVMPDSPTAKLEPVTVRLFPGEPLEALRLMVGVSTVNDGELAVPEVRVTVKAWEPGVVEVGMV